MREKAIVKKSARFDIEHASAKEIALFSLLPFGLMTISNVVGSALNLYFSDVLGLGLVATGLILAVSKLWDAVNDPMMGLIVDRTRSKWGKCRPYILLMALPLMASFILLFSPVEFGDRFGTFTVNQIDMEATFATVGNGFHVVRTVSSAISKGNFIFAMIAYLLFYTFNTAVDIPYQGLPPLLFPDSKQRVRAISFSSILGSIGTILPSIVLFPIVYAFSDQRIGFFVGAIVFSIVGGLSLGVSFFGIKEKVVLKPKRVSYFATLKIIFAQNKNIRILMASVFFASITNLGAMFLIYFCKWNCYGIIDFPALEEWIFSTFHKRISMTEEGILYPLLSITSGISYMLSMAIVPRLLKRMSKKKLFIRQSLIFAAADVAVFLICRYVFPYNSPDLTLARIGLTIYALLRFFTNFPVGMSTVLLTAIFADTVDTIEMNSGERLEGATFSFKSLVNKLGVAGFNLIMMATVQSFGYDKLTALAKHKDALKDAGQILTREAVLENNTTLNAIFFMLTVLGAIGLILQAVPMFFYKFNEEENQLQITAFRDERDRQREAELKAAVRSTK